VLTQRQQQMFFVRKRSVSGMMLVTQSCVVVVVVVAVAFTTDKLPTGRGVLRLSSSISTGVWTPNERN